MLHVSYADMCCFRMFGTPSNEIVQQSMPKKEQKKGYNPDNMAASLIISKDA